MKTYYELLGVAHDAPANEIKQAFRRAIARYHPDKVQHLGEEFQRLAQERASELTVAYKTLVDDERRAVYDASLVEGSRLKAQGFGPDRATDGSGLEAQGSGPNVADGLKGSGLRAEGVGPDEVGGLRGSGPEPVDGDNLRKNRDALLKRAALARADQLLRQALPDSEAAAAAGFDLGYFSKPPKLFGPLRPWVLARFVPRVDAAIVQQVWTQAFRGSAARRVPVCVFLLAGQLPSERELADVLAGNGRATRPGHKITVVPVDVRDWRTWIPRDADPAVKSLAIRLGKG